MKDIDYPKIGCKVTATWGAEVPELPDASPDDTRSGDSERKRYTLEDVGVGAVVTFPSSNCPGGLCHIIGEAEQWEDGVWRRDVLRQHYGEDYYHAVPIDADVYVYSKWELYGAKHVIPDLDEGEAVKFPDPDMPDGPWVAGEHTYGDTRTFRQGGEEIDVPTFSTQAYKVEPLDPWEGA